MGHFVGFFFKKKGKSPTWPQNAGLGFYKEEEGFKPHNKQVLPLRTSFFTSSR